MTAAAATLLAPAGAGAALPDLVSDRPEDPYLQTYTPSTGPSRLLLRFDSFVHNRVGNGPLQIDVEVEDMWLGRAVKVQQAIEGAAARDLSVEQVLFEEGRLDNEDGHFHYHLQRASEYTLQTAGPAPTLVAPSAKVGFCLIDSLPVGSQSDREYRENCRPDALDEKHPENGYETTFTMGVSSGWRDLYESRLANQYVDVSQTLPGTYALYAEVDPDDIVEEAVEANGLSEPVPVRIPGHLPKPRVAGPGASTVVLETTPVLPSTGTLAPPRYLITEAPEHGTIDKPVGQWFTDPVIHYTPNDPANPVADDLRYTALPQDSSFPRTPPTATVTFGGGEHVAISGAPQEMVVGTSVQLDAPGATTWAATAGKVDRGLFTAPASPGTAVVRAQNDAGDAAEVTIRIVAKPAQTPAPVPGDAPDGDTAVPPPPDIAPQPPTRLPAKAFAKASAERVGRYVAVSVTPGRSGTLRVVLRRGTKSLTSCKVRAVAGRSVICRLRRPATGTGKLRVVAELKQLDGKLVRRAVTIKAPHRHHH